MPEVKMYIEIDKYYNDCITCPTIYMAKDLDGDSYMFRLRHGFASIYLETGDNPRTILSGTMEGFDGICDWNDFVFWAKMNNIIIVY